MPSRNFASPWLAYLFLAAATLHAQAKPALEPTGATASSTTNDEGPAGIVPYVKGPNFSLGTTSQHDSDNGWSSILNPDLAYRFNRHYSADATTPIYTYLTTLLSGGTRARPTETPVTDHFVPGDTALNGHFEISTIFDYSLTATLGLPTGSKSLGIGAGQATYNFNNHFEKTIGFVNPDIELGFGDSSEFDNTRARKSYTTVGPLAFFQAGATFDLPRGLDFEAEAYEQLPVAAQTLYSTTGKGKKKVTTAIGVSQAEDNGFLTTLDIPLNPHTTLSGFYNRSLRSHIDTAGFSFTFFLRAVPRQTTIR